MNTKITIFLLLVIIFNYNSVFSQNETDRYQFKYIEEDVFNYLSKNNNTIKDFQIIFIDQQDEDVSLQTIEFYGIPSNNSKNILITNPDKLDFTIILLDKQKKEISNLSNYSNSLNQPYFIGIKNNSKDLQSIVKLN